MTRRAENPRRRSSPRRHWAAFRLRTLLLLLLGGGLWLAPQANYARRQKQAARVVELLGGDVQYQRRRAPWRRRLVGDHGVDRLVGVSLGAGQGDRELPVLGRVAGLRSITDLSLEGGRFTDEGLRRLPELADLKRLTLNETSVTDRGLAELLDRRPSLDILGDPLLMKLARPLSADPKLNLSGRSLTDFSLPRIARLTQLMELSLNESSVTAAGIRSLLPLKRLRALRLNETPLDDAGASALAELPALADLELAGTRVSSRGVQALSKLPLQRLVLDRTGAGASGIRALARCASLQALSLRSVKLNSEAAAALSNLQSLHWLDVTQTGLSRQRVDRLRRELPDTVVAFR